MSNCSLNTCILKIGSLINAIDKHSGLLLVLLTAVYATLTYFILRESRSERLNQKIPVIVFRFRHIPEQLNQHIVRETQERLVNIGSGPALDIQLTTNQKFDGLEMAGKDADGLMPWPNKYPVDNVLGPDSGDPDMQVCFMARTGGLSILKDPTLVLKVRYKDIFGRSYETIFKNCKNEFHTLK